MSINVKYVILLFLIIGSFWCGTLYTSSKIKIEYKEKIIYDTLTRDSIVPVNVYVDRYVDRYVPVYKDKVDKKDTADSLKQEDSVKVQIPISKYSFNKPLEYSIEATGYEVNLTKVTTYPKIVYKTEQVTSYKNPKISLGIQAGYGIIGNKTAPYVGIGVQYNLCNINF